MRIERIVAKLVASTYEYSRSSWRLSHLSASLSTSGVVVLIPTVAKGDPEGRVDKDHL